MKTSQAPLLLLRVTVLTVLVGVVCEGAVSWSGTAAELRVAPGQEKAVTEFAFRNSGQQPLRFTSLRPSSDCLTAAASKEAFAGGEMGAMRVEFTVGGRSGRQEKFVTVRTDDPAEKPVSLVVVVDIPESMAMLPPQLFGEKYTVAAEKTVAILLIVSGKDARVEARRADERFTVAVEPARERGRIFYGRGRSLRRSWRRRLCGSRCGSTGIRR